MSDLIRRIGLGTVQFGCDYGVANQVGQVPMDEVARILDYAFDQGVRVLDTASGYGDSEKVLGDYLTRTEKAFDVVSKFLVSSDVTSARQSLEASLKRLGRTSLTGFLFHRFDDLKDNPALWDECCAAKQDGLVTKIGLSLYYPDEIDYLIDHKMHVDLVQIPMNLFDQRFVPRLSVLKERGVEIHVRSAFLQGLFFLSADALPLYLQRAKQALVSLQQVAKDHDVSIEALCLNFLLAFDDIDCVVIGVDRLEHLKHNLNVLGEYERVCSLKSELMTLSIDDEDILLPFKWNQKA